jgi:hypothetical protein
MCLLQEFPQSFAQQISPNLGNGRAYPPVWVLWLISGWWLAKIANSFLPELN